MSSERKEKIRRLADERRRMAHAHALGVELTLASDEHLAWLGGLMAHRWRCSSVTMSLDESLAFMAGALSDESDRRDLVLSEPLGLVAGASRVPTLLVRALDYLRTYGLSNSLCIGSMSRDTAFTVGDDDHGEAFVVGVRRRNERLQCLEMKADDAGLSWTDPGSGGGADTPYLSAGDPALWPTDGDADET